MKRIKIKTTRGHIIAIYDFVKGLEIKFEKNDLDGQLKKIFFGETQDFLRKCSEKFKEQIENGTKKKEANFNFSLSPVQACFLYDICYRLREANMYFWPIAYQLQLGILKYNEK